MSGAPPTERTYDYIVVGAGSAGCIVAAELSHHGSVLLVERGDRAEDHPETLDADGYKDAFINDAVILERFSARQPACGDRRLFMGSGRGVGGSGAVNGMVYTRGDRRDFDAWPEGWRWADVRPHFEAVERALHVRPRPATEFTSAFLKAAQQAGFRHEPNLNGGDLGGVIGHETMNYEGDRRRNSYVAFLQPRLMVRAVDLRVNTLTERVLIEDGRAVGIQAWTGGTRWTARAAREVVLCAGALETPKLLLLSGVGPAAELRHHGLPVVHELSGVGANFHDHPNATLFFLADRPVDAWYPQLYGFHRANPNLDLPAGQSDSCYVAYPARSSLREAAMRMVPTMLPEALYSEATKRVVRTLLGAGLALPPLQALIRRMYGVVVILGKPLSRGRVGLRSVNPAEPAMVDPGYLTHPADRETMRRAVEKARAIAGAPALAAFGNRPLMPRETTQTDAWLRQNVMTTYHYAGTCALGAVVDADLKVKGLDALRVADASVIPETPVSALNAPSMMIGHRAARLILDGRAG